MADLAVVRSGGLGRLTYEALALCSGSGELRPFGYLPINAGFDPTVSITLPERAINLSLLASMPSVHHLLACIRLL